MAQGPNVGLLECDFCKNIFSIHEVNFPPDLYDLMVKYDISQLIWLCSSCKKKKEQNIIYFLSLADRQREMEKVLRNMVVAINQIQSAIDLNPGDIGPVSRNLCTHTDFGKNIHSSITRNDWEFIYLNDEDTSTCSVKSKVCGSTSSGSPVNTDTQSQADAIKPCPSLSSGNYNGKDALGILKKILSEKITINEDEMRRNKAVLENFLDKFVNTLKEKSAEFKQLYRRNYYTGSTYEKLRIASADEFDIDLVLKFPLQKKAFKVEFMEEYPSFARCILVDQQYEKHPQLLKLFFEKECLMPSKVRSWMQSLISKFITVENFELPDNVEKLIPSQSGPASTIKLITTYGCRIDIDLVPVLQFADSEWPPDCDVTSLDGFELNTEDKFLFIVPKPFTSGEGETAAECQQLWRVHFPGVEKKFIRGRGCIKPIIKLLKLLRDKEDSWDILCSYYLKTVLMWEIRAHPDVMYWDETRLGDRFHEVLKKLAQYIKFKNLPHFLYPEVNLIQRMKYSHSTNIFGRLQNIIKKIEKDTSNLLPVFGLAV